MLKSSALASRKNDKSAKMHLLRPRSSHDLQVRALGSSTEGVLRPAGAGLAEGASNLAEACSKSELALITRCEFTSHVRV